MSSKTASTDAAQDRLVVALEERSAEAWTRVALAVFVLFAAGVFYLGLRPGGYGPVWVYVAGRSWIALLALAVLVYGVIRSFRRRPFLQPARVRAFFALTVVVGVANYPLPYPSSHEGHPSSVRFELPVEGEWTVIWGGEEKHANRLAMFYADRRFGLQLVRTVDGARYAGEGARLEEHYAFDQPVLAPAAGRIARVHDGEPDLPPGVRFEGGEPFGNHLVIEVAEGEFVFLTHLRQGSIEVAEGAVVETGAPLARVGASGFAPLTPGPHVAVHLQDTPVPHRGEAVPWRFSRYVADGAFVELGLPRGGVARDGRLIGERVQRAEP